VEDLPGARHYHVARCYLAIKPRGLGYPINRDAPLGGANTRSCPLMGYVENSVLRSYLHHGTAIDPHRKHDPLEPLLYFTVDLVNRDTDESGG
jgi:hypothetical protein